MNQENTKIMCCVKISVFKDLFKSKEVPYILDLQKIIDRIKLGKSENIITKIRETQSKELQKSLKESLPSILFAGEFSQRNSNGLTNHSGLMVVDFDKYETAEKMQEHLELLKQNKHFVLLFISPSGNGIKGVVKIPTTANKETHPKFFKGFNKTFKYDYFDISNSNVDRVCFESFDPNIYVNFDAEIFEVDLSDNGHERTERVPMLPITNEDLIIDRIMAFNWKGGFLEGQRNDFVFNLASAFCEYGISQSTAVGYIQNNITYGDFSDRECETAIRSAYKSRPFNTKYFEDYKKILRVKVDLKKGKKEVIKEHGISEDTYLEISKNFEADDFWIISDKGKVTISSIRYKLFLENNGFKKYFPSESVKSILVKIRSNKVSITSPEIIKDFVLNYLLTKNEFSVYDFCAKYEILFNEKYLMLLDTIELNMLRDTAEKTYIGYQNGILEVEKNSVNLIDYLDLKGYIWENHILKRDFVEVGDFSNGFQKFITNISNNNPKPIECTLGYLMSTFKKLSNNKAVILNDETISLNPMGGTGKGIFVQALQEIRRVSVINGKKIEENKSFEFQTVQPDCQILVFDDVKPNYNFENNFSIVTEGITIEKKNKDAIKISVQDSPKLLITTNYAIKGEGDSHERRRHELEFTKFYSAKFTPHDDFGMHLFRDWNNEMFQRYDNYVVHCIQLFMKNGLIAQNTKNIKTRKFIAETSIEFLEFIDDAENFPRNSRLNKKMYYDKFLDDYPDFKKWLNRKTFVIWVQKYSTYKDLIFSDGNTQGERWYMVADGNEPKIIEDGLVF